MGVQEGMDLKSIKLAGFKSFADPTDIPLEGRLTAIVGPNGCGKSNIVDAVRCVLSGPARQLRGDSLGDIVFNGSTGRPPVGWAAVELLLDNSAGRLQGEYAAYTEICIRREISRDGDSQYYLNGTRCRRRDAVDVVLGTGLKYAIIEQGMITRLIEAKPEDLRLYLEEAAGTSKYKERRRETENRLRHTRENLARLNDLCLEQEKQLAHLQRQANAAERYKVLKQEERLLKAQLQTLNWRTLATALVEQEAALQEAANQLATYQTEQSDLHTHITQSREHEKNAATALNTLQTNYYTMGIEAVRLEQQLQQHCQQQQQLEQELLRLEQAQQAVQQHGVQDQQRITTLEQEIIQLEPQMAAANGQVIVSEQQLQTAEQVMQEWQSQWDEFQQQEAKTKQFAEVEHTRLQHLQQTIQTNEQHLARIQQEQQLLLLTPVEQEIEQLNSALHAVQTKIAKTQNELTQTVQHITQHREVNTELSKQLDLLRQQLQQIQGRYASLQALQQAALGNNDQNLVNWLQAQKLTERPRLVQTLQVEVGWELAVETVLGAYLQAVCVDDIVALSSQLADLKQGQLSLIQCETSEKTNTQEISFPLLRSKIKENFYLPAWLSTVYSADDLTQALNLLTHLKSHESVITRDGIWLARHWIRITKPLNVEAGLLQREAELQNLIRQVHQQEQAVNEAQQKLSTAQADLTQLEQLHGVQQEQLREQTAELSALQAQLSVKQARVEHMQQRARELAQELAQTQGQLTQIQQQSQQAQANWQQATQQMQELTERRHVFLQERERYQQQVSLQRAQAQTDRQAANQYQMQLESMRQQLNFLQQTLQRAEKQLLDLAENQRTLQEQLTAVIAPQQAFQKDLHVLSTHRNRVEQELQAAQQRVADIKSALVHQEELREGLEEKIQEWRDVLEQARIQRQALQLKQANHQEKIHELGAIVDDLLNDLPAEANQNEWDEKVSRIEQRIHRLGAINLAAIEEHQQLAERKDYLDAQYKDLLEAVNTLESAIRKIDQESRAKLQETYDKVNELFKELFQRVFNGGQASLELTEDNWQSAGILVRAQPPGKRNNTIHLLSGGEKSLTAIALIFALFQLNPAPFCMLDEVDAALDDANVARFCHLLKEMSQQVQFIVISHNKQTIAAAQKLIGITMNEPGVSRIVSVDMEQAVAMAE